MRSFYLILIQLLMTSLAYAQDYNFDPVLEQDNTMEQTAAPADEYPQAEHEQAQYEPPMDENQHEEYYPSYEENVDTNRQTAPQTAQFRLVPASKKAHAQVQKLQQPQQGQVRVAPAAQITKSYTSQSKIKKTYALARGQVKTVAQYKREPTAKKPRAYPKKISKNKTVFKKATKKRLASSRSNSI